MLSSVVKGYTKWFLYVVQEPSLGLYYVQNHFKDSLDKTIENKVNWILLRGITLDLERG